MIISNDLNEARENVNKNRVYINKVKLTDSTDYHKHDFIEIAFVAKGEGIHIVDDKEMHIKEGEIFVLNYNVYHKFIVNRGNLVIFNCIFTPGFFDYSLIGNKNFKDIKRNFLFHSFFIGELTKYWRIVPDDEMRYKFKQLYENMFLEFCNKNDGYIDVIRGNIVELLINIFRHLKKDHNLIALADSDSLFDEVIRFIDKNYKDSITLEDLSTLVYLTPSYISKKFKDKMGINFKTYLQEIRIKNACMLLAETDRTITSIANETGYSDMKFFNTLFKKCMKMTPSEFRKNENANLK